jgi:hypothetical protein
VPVSALGLEGRERRWRREVRGCPRPEGGGEHGGRGLGGVGRPPWALTQPGAAAAAAGGGGGGGFAPAAAGGVWRRPGAGPAPSGLALLAQASGTRPPPAAPRPSPGPGVGRSVAFAASAAALAPRLSGPGHLPWAEASPPSSLRVPGP